MYKCAWNKNAHMRVCCNVYNFSRPGHKGDHSLGIKSAKINKPTPLALSRACITDKNCSTQLQLQPGSQ
jgi:hypothetical protein